MKSMQIMRVNSPEFRMAELIWNNEPISLEKLIELCEKEISWNEPKVQRELRALYKRRIFKEEDGVITSMISYEDYSSRLKAYDNFSKADALVGFIGASDPVYRGDRKW